MACWISFHRYLSVVICIRLILCIQIDINIDVIIVSDIVVCIPIVIALINRNSWCDDQIVVFVVTINIRYGGRFIHLRYFHM